MNIRKLAIISTILLIAAFALGYAVYHEVRAQLNVELNLKEVAQ